ncbi:MAG: 2-amino-4-hydroxy-6-hydroxymethyldihydropteridine diphosphokinase [Gammaproteobacteria bacterium]
MSLERAYIGLGSNLEDPVAQVRRALRELDELPDTDLTSTSVLYSSAPMGPPDQPDYVNAVAALDTGLAPRDLLAHLQAIESAHGRVRTRHWGARTLDLDLLLYGQLRLREDRLVVPHPGMHERAFVLYPLAEIAPGLRIPGGGLVDDLLRACPRAGLEKLEPA